MKKSKSILFLSFILLALVCILKVSTTDVYADSKVKYYFMKDTSHRGDHNWVKWDIHINEKRTCCKGGIQAYKCSKKNCGVRKLVYTDKLPHQFSGPRSYILWKRKATCFQTGIYKIKCNYCNTMSGWKTRPKKTHSWTKVNLNTKTGICAYCGIPHKLTTKEYKAYLKEISGFTSK